MLDDRPASLGDDLADLRAAALDVTRHALGREPDRREGVLDLVRDAPRHLAPGRQPLRPLQLGEVLEGDHPPFGTLVPTQRHDRHLEVPRQAARVDGQRSPHRAGRGLNRLRDGREAPPCAAPPGATRRSPAPGTPSIAAAAGFPRTRPRSASSVSTPVRTAPRTASSRRTVALQLLVALPQALHHRVERPDEHPDLVLGRERHLFQRLAAGDPLRGRGQREQRRREPPRQVEAEPDRRERHEQGEPSEPQDHRRRDRRAFDLEPLVGDATGREACLRLRQVGRKRLADEHDGAVRQALPGAHHQRPAEALAAHAVALERLRGERRQPLQHALPRVGELDDRDAVAQPAGEVIAEFGVQPLELGQTCGLARRSRAAPGDHAGGAFRARLGLGPHPVRELDAGVRHALDRFGEPGRGRAGEERGLESRKSSDGRDQDQHRGTRAAASSGTASPRMP